MKNIVGIDLGTTFSGIAKLNSVGLPEIVPNKEGERITSSTIYFDKDEGVIVGELARNMSLADDTRYVRVVKRYMGEEYYPKEIAGKMRTPSKLSAFILKKIADDFEALNGKIDKAVITVPAYFAEMQRKATMDAAEKAGINVVGLVNEPTAAALYYATQYQINGKVLVFDLGGGTFDVTLLQVENEDIEILCSKGDSKLGGYDFDNEILNDIDGAYKAKFGRVLLTNSEVRNRWIQKAEIIKMNLSKISSTNSEIYGDGGILNYVIDRVKFNKLISKYIAKMEMLTESALDEINILPNQVDHIILVGGSTRIPRVEELIREIFNKSPKKIGNVDECVALGAALHAGLMVNQTDPSFLTASMRDTIEKINLTDVCNHSYGTHTLSYIEEFKKHILINDILIPKNTKLPCEVTKTYYTVMDNQTEINVVVTQGESDDPEDVNVLANRTMRLPSNRPQGQPVKVTYKYDINQMMSCEFYDENSGILETITLNSDLLNKEGDSSNDEFEALLDF